jgi:hypothetical protein
LPTRCWLVWRWCISTLEAQLKKVLGWAENRTSKEAPDVVPTERTEFAAAALLTIVELKHNMSTWHITAEDGSQDVKPNISFLLVWLKCAQWICAIADSTVLQKRFPHPMDSSGVNSAHRLYVFTKVGGTDFGFGKVCTNMLIVQQQKSCRPTCSQNLFGLMFWERKFWPIVNLADYLLNTLWTSWMFLRLNCFKQPCALLF